MIQLRTDLKPLYRVDLIEKDGQHFYTIDGSKTYLKGVTGPLGNLAKPGLLPWTARETAEYMSKIYKRVDGLPLRDGFHERVCERAKKQARFVKETAARKGSFAHKLFDAFITKNEVKDAANDYWSSFEYWVKKEKLTIVAGDLKVASKEWKYGGSLDALAVNQYNQYVVIDFKCGKHLYDSHAYQVAAYAKALSETYQIPYLADGVVIRFVPRKPKFERREVRDMHLSLEGFKASLDASNVNDAIHFKNRKTYNKEKEIKKYAAA